MKVYAVHSIKADEIRPTEVIFRYLAAAERHAKVISSDPGVLGAAVTTFELDQFGRRTATSLYVAGEKQSTPWISDDRRVAANGFTVDASLRPKRSRTEQ